MSVTRILLSWSSGKDSAYSLHKLVQDPKFDVVGLLTSFDERAQQVPIQGTPISAVRLQAKALGLPLVEVPMPKDANNQEYQAQLLSALSQSSLEFDGLAFGDLFLDGIVEFRRQLFEPAGYSCHFPLLGQAPATLAREIQAAGIKAFLVSTHHQHLSNDFCGREYDASLLNDLPEAACPCGERGEFHSFVYDSPQFAFPLRIRKGQQTILSYAYQKVKMQLQTFEVEA
ncbi:ATPase [Paraferrimonas sedimenticola]|uniref:ATPase n=1 Tax=Paraferrimonas sedimenticola TaxID=375674 RepID=A0AA37W129_9GAMM|nr:ATPase [Paraferrimonas sedimenticola]GLP95817.1 ATPase [Paraferrimonas sedimenticola]